MPNSRINPEYQYDQKTWIVSIINTTDMLIGHSALVVEGLEMSTTSIYPNLFVGQYDIATIDNPAEEVICAGSSFSNDKGFITKIKSFDNQEYSLCSMLDDTKAEKGKFYIRKNENTLEYTVLNPIGVPVHSEINARDFKAESKEFKEFKNIIQDPFSIEGLNSFFPTILKITSRRAHTHLKNTRNYEELKYPGKSYPVSYLRAKEMIRSIYADEIHCIKAMENSEIEGRNLERQEEEQEPLHLDEKDRAIERLRFQKLGKDHPLIKLFGNPEKGNNCTGWCLEKLLVAGVDPGHIKPKPMFAAGQTPKCLIS